MTAAQPVDSNTARMCSAPSIPPETIDRHGQLGDEPRGQLVVRRALVAHRGGARVEGETGDAGVLDQPARELEALDAAGLERGAQLDGDREAGALARGARDGDRRVRVA